MSRKVVGKKAENKKKTGKQALRKDFNMEIRKSLGRFLSIFFIVAIGVAFFSGIRASEPDMRYSGDEYFDEHNLMDIQVISTLGLTDEDIEALEQVDGIEHVEGGYSVDAVCATDDSQAVVHIMSLLPNLNQVTVEEGHLPKSEKECVVDVDFLKSSGYSIGDEITFSSGKKSALTETLETDTYTIVGAVSSPCYISFHRGSTTIGTGSIDGFACVRDECFKLDVYTELYATVEGAKELTAFTDEYDARIKEVCDNIEEIREEREQARYDQLIDDANAELDKARKEYEDAKKDAQKQLDEAKQQLDDGKSQINAAQSEITDGTSELEAAQAQLTDGAARLEAAQSQITEGKNQLDSLQSQINSGWVQITDAQSEIISGQTQIAEAQEQLTAAQSQVDAAQAEVDSARAELEQSKSLLTTVQELFDEAKAKLDEQNAALQNLIAERDALQAEYDALVASGTADEATLQQMRQQIESLNSRISISQSALSTLQSAADTLQAELDQVWSRVTEGEQELADAQAQLDEKKQELANAQAQLDAKKQEMADGAAVLDTKRQELYAGQQAVDENRKSLASGQAEVDANRKELEAGQAEVEAGRAELEAGQAELDEKKQELAEGEEEYNQAKKDAEEQFAEAEEQLKDAEDEISKIEHAKWYVYDRDNLTEYSGYGENADRMRAIGQVFPVLFFLVAALISLTTMTRMVEEQRTQIGTLKALGYSRTSVAAKYIGYAFLATILGCIVGILFGEKVFPYIIIMAYKIMYPHLPNVVVPYELKYALTASIAALACTILATVASCFRELREPAAQLMRPPTPKQGKRILLERIPFIWKHLSFSWKSTIRNLVRYKKRFFMTVFGIGGCMALLLFGFGLEDSIYNIGKLQYGELQLYDGDLILNTEASAEEQERVLSDLENDSRVESDCLNLLKNVVVKSGDTEKEVYLNVPENIDEFTEFIILRDRKSHEPYAMTDEGVILTEKMSEYLDVEPGDTIMIKDEVKGELEVQITAICENYMSHYLYMTPTLYEELYGEEPEYNSVYFSVTDGTEKTSEAVGETMLELEGALSCSYTRDFRSQIEHMLSALDYVIVVLVAAAGLLAFVVLYNLNNINITERKRELATLKVLGFYPGEVATYVYRENIILTLIGALVGMGLGKILHRFVITTVEVESAMFGRNIDPSSFVIGFVVTVAFALFVNGIMYFKLKKIDMVESLKSVE